MDKRNVKLLRDLILFIISLSLAWWIIKSDVLESLFSAVLPLQLLAEFIAGMMYSNFLTSPVSVASLIVLAEHNNPILIAVTAGLGAAFGDFLFVKFVKKTAAEDLHTVSSDLRLEKISQFLKRYKMEFLIIVFAYAIIASPFPDEIGLTILSTTKMQGQTIFFSAFLLNTAGILLITTAANLL